MKKIINLFLSVMLLCLGLIPVQASDYFNVDVGYQGQTNNVWTDFAYGGALAGSEGGEALDGLEIHLVDSPYASAIEYRIYTVSGWTDWFSTWQTASQNGEDLLGAQIRLKDFPNANVYYQSYRKGLGWGTWVSNGSTSGQLNAAYPITGFRVQVDEIGVNYQSSINGVTQVLRHNGETQGTGSLETISMSLISGGNGSIEYRAYMRGTGWTNWARNGAVIGSTGLVIEGLEARLIDLPQYSVQIQPEVEGVWWDYVYDGQTAGSLGSRLTGYRVEIVQRVYVAPSVVAAVEEEEEEVVVGGGSTLNTTPLSLDTDGDGFDDPFYTLANSYLTNIQIVNPYRVQGLTVVSYSVEGISVIDGFNSYGDNAVNSSQFEVYMGTYVGGIFTVISGTGVSSAAAIEAGSTHTMILYDNEDESVEGYTSQYTGDPEHLNGIVMSGVYHEGGWSITGSSGSKKLVYTLPG